ncbi:serine/threonine protein kinase [Lusitaniella coriacea LEGE 07157]|uniref:non-specific serine/threonine protein kinase n=1 Tax=Lusitaniella coriacea LEGE 07157 TaxID=945747 RepID=A0A8J7IS30_9CYAN|nr:serine/threonine-protein kinase [Lusitaniella coriacea]MBE9115862.1 serine/threonine protein kinase [Lusitaniella coriacea LEGE 07157]
MTNENQYILDDSIGQGTFSHTQKALISGSQQPVIIKTLAQTLRDRPEQEQFKQHFRNLARRLVRCKHPHLAKVVELFEEEGSPYIVYEFIPGTSLADRVEMEGSIPEAQALTFIRQVAAAVNALHEAGLHHLAIKPQNIIQRRDKEEVILVEFGLTCELNPNIKQTHANLLASGYAAPEQHDPEQSCSPATDIYALAATLYCLLVGNPPPPAPLLDRIPSSEWQQHLASCAPTVKNAILQGLIVDPLQRPQSVVQWLALLTPKPTPAPNKAVSSQKTSEKTVASPPSKPKTKPPAIAYQTATVPHASPKAKTHRPNSKPKFPLGALATVCAIAASAGMGFGFSLRFNSPSESGSSLWHLKQSFPPRSQESIPLPKPE